MDLYVVMADEPAGLDTEERNQSVAAIFEKKSDAEDFIIRQEKCPCGPRYSLDMFELQVPRNDFQILAERSIKELKRINLDRCTGCRQICRDFPNEMCSAYQALTFAISSIRKLGEIQKAIHRETGDGFSVTELVDVILEVDKIIEGEEK